MRERGGDGIPLTLVRDAARPASCGEGVARAVGRSLVS